ncbi:TaqI-like C-terminal specificity domain-containing protein [Myroides marinus]|uniref:TaqI-like C-terminal specificity domain-containing protein n=1 Tax=Myroides marinus TaxID=703342 RepID=UPI0025787DCF|nr:TaqI-like C-terminal specificity domain-containing protein [Myroides marinus]
MPLKNWDITINYGIKTGYNEAFIIDNEKREELIRQDPKSAEIIRPLLRGRDIKRYSYDYAELYIISTFPSQKIDIEMYPAVKKHLINFGYDRLEQSGNKGSRKKTNNQWFETQDSIGYMDDFFRPKIIWKRIGSILKFSYDDTGILSLDSTCIATGKKYMKYLLAILNSDLGKYLLKDSPKTGTGDLLISVQAINPLKIPIPNDTILEEIDTIVDSILENKNNSISLQEHRLNDIFYELLNFNSEEIRFISQ